MKICLVASPGGHLTQLLYLKDAFAGQNVFYITYVDPRTANLPRTYVLQNIWKEPQFLLIMLPRILAILLREKPDLIISTGAEIAIPVFLTARLLGIRTMFIESLARVESKSMTGSVLYPLSSIFLVQWPNLLSIYGRRASYWGSLL